MIKGEVEYQTCILSDALHRNINDNFESVSFEFLENGDVRAKIVLSKLTEAEEDYIHDLIGEFEAAQVDTWVAESLIEVGESLPLTHLVYRKGGHRLTERSASMKSC